MSKYFEEPEATIYHGNCLEELKDLADNSVDAIVTDPPYGLGDSDPDYILNALKMWISGDRSHIPAGKGFMGKKWDSFVPPPAVWDECYRVLKPGGHILVFAGTRTQDLMCLSVRMAGFEIRDSIAWIYAQGFPKSLDISKAIDKMAGAEREVIGTAGNAPDLRDVGAKSKEIIGIDKLSFGQVQNAERTEVLITAPATDDAKKWSGWGTAVKPALEPIIVGRKPLSEKNVALNVLKWGTGGINIDESRIGFTSENDIAQYDFNQNGQNRSTKEDGESLEVYDGGWKVQKGEKEIPSGRFPSNVIFSHADGCTPTGEIITSKTVAGNRTATFGTQETISGGDGSGGFDGYEYQIEVYACVDGCPVKELDEQSGITTSGKPRADRGTGGIWKEGNGIPAGQQHGDKGGASRFFFVAKASKKDRNEGLVDVPEKGKVYNGKSEESAGNAPGSVEDKFTTKPQANHHPTVKPTSLMEYLIKLITPAGGIVLDPFAGSGSTGKAAVRNDFKFIGVEITGEYLPILKGRVEHEITEKRNSLF